MKTFLTFIYTLFFLTVLLASCNSRRPLEPEIRTETTFVEKMIRDTVFQTEANTTYYDAWIECVNGKPKLRKPNPTTKPASSGQKSNGALQPPKVNLDEDGKLTVECRKEVEEIRVQLVNHYEKILKEHQKPVYIEKELKWYQKALMWAGGIFFLLILIAVIVKVKK